MAKLECAGAEPHMARVFSFGAVAALYQVAMELGVVEIIDRFVPKRNQGPSVGEYMLIAAINRAVDPKSKRQIGEWYSQTSLSRWLKARPEHLSRLAEAGVDMSIEAILEQLSDIYEVAHIYPSESRKKDTFTLSEMNEVQLMLAQTLGLEAMHRLAS